MFTKRRTYRLTGRPFIIGGAAVIASLAISMIGGCPPESETTRLDVRSKISAVEPVRGPTIGGTSVTIFGQDFEPGTQVMFGAFLSPQVEVVSAEEIRAVLPAQADGMADIALLLPSGTSFLAPTAFEYVSIANADSQIIAQVERAFPGPPRLVSAIALNNTRIRLTFNEPVAGVAREDGTDADGNPVVTAPATGALDPANYQIVIPEGGNLIVDDGRDLEDPTEAPNLTFSSNQTVVEITTLSQADANYLLTVAGITDLARNPISPPDILVNPAQAAFRGIAPVAFDTDGNVIHVDRDGDGFADWFEMLGWDITIELANGVIVQSHVTSDPYTADTDCDGLTDSEENARSLDPRTDDTDADRVTDCDETRIWLSNPADQDTDNDGLSDETEVSLNTSLVLADTDGDQLSDREEIVLRNRNPRLADLPLPQIRIGTMNLEIDERFSYTDETGVEQTIESSSSSSFLQSDTTTFAESSTTSTTASEVYNASVEGGYGDGSSTGGAYVRVAAGFEHSEQRGYSSTISEESSRTAQQEYSESLAQALSTSERREVTRTAEGARLSIDVTVANSSDVSFTLSNLELTARVQEGRNRERFLPLASLLPASGNESFNLGALQSQRGPFIFENAEIFPNLAQDLLREPRTIIFDIANYDIVDEFGRNFAFTSEEINDLTAGILIDFGDGRVEQYRVATASEFVPLDGATDQIDGCDECPAEGPRVAKGIQMRQALEEIGLFHAGTETVNLSDAELAQSTTLNSWGTTLVDVDDDNDPNTPNTQIRILTRMRDVQSDVENSPRDKRFWVVMTPTGELEDVINFNQIMLHPRDDYQLWYTQDVDEDGLYARQEFLAGSSDNSVDTDSDGLTDFEEIKTGWLVQLFGQAPYTVFPNPARADTDFDGVDDIDERKFGTDPRAQDTDRDGLDEATELAGFELERYDDNGDDSDNEFIMISAYTNLAIIEPCSGADETVTTAAAGDDVQLVAVGATVSPGTPIIGPGVNNVIDTTPDGDETIGSWGPMIIATEEGTADTTASGDDVQVIPVGDDVEVGDVVIRAGCDGVLQTVPVGTEAIRANHRSYFATDPLLVDTDFDSLSDGREELLGSNPNDPRDAALDSDGDGLLDSEETTGWTVEFVHRHNTCADGDSNCRTTVQVTSDPFNPDTDRDGLPDALEAALRTNPRLRDTDGDTLSDLREYQPDFRLEEYFGDDIADRLTRFDARCSVSPDCSFTPAANPIGSSPLDVDSDDDGLIDQFEVNGWMVDVIDNDPPYLVVSDPTIADTDGDGLSDRDEWRGADGVNPNSNNDSGDATDPLLQDTDGDNVNDDVELNQNQGNTIDYGSRNPLKRDQLLRIDYDRFKVIQDCDNTAVSTGNFQFRLYLRTQNGTLRTIVHSTNDRQDLGSGCGSSSPPCHEENGCNIRVWNMGNGDEVNIPNSFRRTFVLDYGETASVEVWWTEKDGTQGCNDDGRFPHSDDRSITGPINSDLDRTFEYNPSSGNACETKVDYKVQIINN